MVTKSKTERTSVRLPIPIRDMANEKARDSNMNTLEWLTRVITEAEAYK